MKIVPSVQSHHVNPTNRIAFSHIEAPGFDPLFHNTSFGAAKSIALLKHMNWILNIMLALPESVAVKMGEEVSSSVRLKRVRRHPRIHA